MRILKLLLPVLLLSLGARAHAQQLYYIHTDQLNTPRMVTDGTGTAVWRWDQVEPFGDNPPDEDPDGDSVVFYMPLRFPGQYLDKETNLHYNYFRDYDPGIGRYEQSDPIGLRGGVSTYAYVGGNPISFTDPLGLQQFPIPTSGTSGVQQAGAQAMACALNPAACNPPPACTCSSPQGPDPDVAGNIIGGSMVGFGTAGAVAGGVAGGTMVAGEAAGAGAIGGLIAADAVASGAVAGGVVGGAVGAAVGIVAVGGYYYYTSRPSNNSCSACCP